MWSKIEGRIIPVVFLFFGGWIGASAQDLTPFQKKSLEDYILQYGDILSANELSLVDGFTTDDALWLWSEFGSSLNGQDDRNRSQFSFNTSFKKKYRTQGFSTTQKALYERGRWEGAFTVDNDPGERYPDFISGYLQYGGLTVGDFATRFGSGLVLWTGFTFSSFGEPATLARQGGGITGYRSNDENANFRGAAFRRRSGAFETSVFASYNSLDARVVDSVYTSLKTTGLHATETDKAHKDAMHETVGGVNITYSSGTWRFGLTAALYGYDKHNGRRVLDYNELQIYDGVWGNAGVNFFGTVGSLKLFGEAAIDVHGAPAVTAGIHWSPSYNFELSFTGRAFSPAYIATHAADGSYNKIGASYAMKYQNDAWKVNLNADYNYYPWYRFNMPAGTSVFKGRAAVTYTSPIGLALTTQMSYSERFKLRLHATLPAGRFAFSTRVEVNTGGYALFVEPSVTFRKFRMAARVTWYNTDGWDSRIYLYEKGIPQTFGSTAYYGKGIGEYLVVKYSPTDRMDFWLKFQQDYSAFLIRIFIPG